MKYFNAYEKSKIPFKFGRLDIAGVPQTNLKVLKLSNADEFVYHPTPIIQYGLALYNLFIDSKDDTIIEKLKPIINWLKNEILRNNGFLLIPFAHKELKLKNPWVSGMTQGQALSLLTLSKKLYSFDVDDAIAQLFKSFSVRKENGGFSNETSDEYFIEEAGDFKILNGFIYGFMGLIHYYEDTEHKNAHKLIKKAQNYLHNHLDKYDLGWWSLYSLKIPYHVADKYYHNVHILQLNYLGNYLHDEILKSRAEKWQKYIDAKPDLRYKLSRLIYLVRYKFFTLLG